MWMGFIRPVETLDYRLVFIDGSRTGLFQLLTPTAINRFIFIVFNDSASLKFIRLNLLRQASLHDMFQAPPKLVNKLNDVMELKV